jgi:polyphosphate kinase
MSVVRDLPSASDVAHIEDRFLNRELSQVDFNARVLALAEDESAPLLERAKFLAIFATNTDEFYQVRVAGLKHQAAAGIRTRSADGLTPQEQLSAIAAKTVPLAGRHARVFADSVMPALRDADVKVLRWGELDRPQREELNLLFREKIFPVLTPLAVDAGRPFPYISNLSLNLAVLVRDPSAGRMHFARI